jgi:septum site-determining protein MinC
VENQSIHLDIRIMTSTALQAFNLKADLVAMTVLQITEASLDLIENQLNESIAKAPAYFKDAPIIIDISKIPIALKEFIDLNALMDLLKKCGLSPIGIRGALDKQDEHIKQLGLTKLNARTNIAATEEKSLQTENAQAAAKNTEKPKPPSLNTNTIAANTKVITKPVRSGMQVYAKNADLLILSSVNSGAEVIADGNIYVFGALKGRALAGAKGNAQARIICQQLDAELVAIAGQYLTKETLGNFSLQKGMLHIYLNEKQLMIEPT